MGISQRWLGFMPGREIIYDTFIVSSTGEMTYNKEKPLLCHYIFGKSIR